MLWIKGILDPVHEPPLPPRGAEDIVAFFEVIRGFFKNRMPADGLHPLSDFVPGGIPQTRASEKDPPEAEIDQDRSLPGLLSQKECRLCGAVGRGACSKYKGVAGDAGIELAEGAGNHVVVRGIGGPEVGLLEKDLAPRQLGGDRLREAFETDSQSPAIAAVFGLGRRKHSPEA